MDHRWLHSSANAGLPPFAVVGGHDCDGSPIYVGRSFHEGDTLPAKVIPSKGCAYVPWGGREITKTHYEILTGENYKWIPCAAGSVPPNSVLAGNTVTGEPLYVGRGHWQGSLTVGKIHPSHHCLYIPFGGQEHRLDRYEVLVYERTHGWVPAQLHHAAPGAVVAGHDTDGSTIYVGRAFHEGENLPAKLVPNKGCAYVCFGGAEIYKTSFEALTGQGYYWVKMHHGAVPPGAVSTGTTRNGEPVFVGRGHHHGSLTPGKVHPSHHCLYIPYGGKEVKLTTYEVLVKNW